MVVYYEKRLKKVEKENRKMSKRLVQTRNSRDVGALSEKRKFKE